MTKPPRPLPRTCFLTETKQSFETSGQCSPMGRISQEDNPMKDGHIQHSSSLLTPKPLPPLPLPRSKSHSEPLSKTVGQSQSNDSEEATKPKEEDSTDTNRYQTPRPLRQPPPLPPKNRKGRNASLLRQTSTSCPWGGYYTLDNKTTSLKLSVEEEGKKGPHPLSLSPLSPLRSPPPPPLPPPPPPPLRPPPHLPRPPAGLYRSASEQGYIPLYLEILPEETINDEVSHGKKMHSSYSNRPLPPIPRSVSHSEPLYEELGWCSNNQYVNTEDHPTVDSAELMQWWSTGAEWENMPLNYRLSEEEKTRVFTKTAYRVQMGLHLFTYLMTKCLETLKNYITELNDIADHLGKTRHKSKIAAITGGTTGAIGGVAIVAGIALAPLTMCASLVVTAVGAGVAAAGGVTGASAAITGKVSNSLDRKKVEKILQDYQKEISDIEKCLEFVSEGMERMRRQDTTRLRNADWAAVKVARLAEVVHANTSTVQDTCQSTEIIKGFASGMDFYFNDGDTQKLKKGSEIKFVSRIRKLTQQLQEGLNNIVKMQKTFSSAAKMVEIMYEEENI